MKRDYSKINWSDYWETFKKRLEKGDSISRELLEKALGKKRSKQKAIHIGFVENGDDSIIVTNVHTFVPPMPPFIADLPIPEGIKWEEAADAFAHDLTMLPHWPNKYTGRKRLLKEYANSIFERATKLWHETAGDESSEALSKLCTTKHEVLVQVLHVFPTIFQFPKENKYRWILDNLQTVFTERRYYAFKWLYSATEKAFRKLPSIWNLLIKTEYETKLAREGAKKGDVLKEIARERGISIAAVRKAISRASNHSRGYSRRRT